MSRVYLEIDHLVLDGVAEPRTFTAALEAELGRRLSERSLDAGAAAAVTDTVTRAVRAVGDVSDATAGRHGGAAATSRSQDHG